MSQVAADDNAQTGEKVKPESDEDILKEARDRYQACDTNENDNREEALDDLLFLSGGVNQWDPASAALRAIEKRPMITVNNMPTFLHQVTNEQRINKRAVKVHPVDDDADIDTAEVEQGLIRHIEYDSNADVAYDTAVNSAAAIGFGWFRLVTEFENERTDDQKIMFKRIRNALSVHIDPLSQEPDGSDMKFGFIDSLESRKEFERQYPKAEANNTDLIGQEMYRGWFTQDTVLVTEYYRIKETPAALNLMSDGTKLLEGDEVPPGVSVVRKLRNSYRCIVEWFKLTGSDILERTEIKCKWVPIFPVYGDEIDIQGKVVRSGIIRNAKDSFKAYNYWITLATEEMALRPKTPFIGYVGQFETAKDQWAQANTRSYAFIEADPITVDGNLAGLPQRQPMADVPTGAIAMMLHAADNKKATTGLFDSSLGAKGTATSGIQEREQQAQGDVANFHYTDNLNITVRHVGRCLVSMIPHYYDAARTVRILGEDDTAKQVKINQTFEKKNPKTGAVEQVLHNLTVGTYDITVSSGPSYSTKRQEAVEFMTEAMRAAKDPASASVITYLAFKNQDMAGADEATRMLKKLLPPNIAEPDEEDDAEPMIQTPKGPIPVSQAGEAIVGMDQALQQAEQAIEQAKVQDGQNKARELEIKDKEAETKKYEAETSRMLADAALIKAGAEAKAADENLVMVAQSAAREAVALVGEIQAQPPINPDPTPGAPLPDAGMQPPPDEVVAVEEPVV